MRQGWGTGRLPTPFPLACVVGRLSLVKKIIIKKNLGLPEARNSSGAPKGDCGRRLAENEVFVPGQPTVATPLGASELFSWDYRTPERAPWAVRGAAAVSWLRTKCLFPASRQPQSP